MPKFKNPINPNRYSHKTIRKMEGAKRYAMFTFVIQANSVDIRKIVRRTAINATRYLQNLQAATTLSCGSRLYQIKVALVN